MQCIETRHDPHFIDALTKIAELQRCLDGILLGDRHQLGQFGANFVVIFFIGRVRRAIAIEAQ